VITELQTQLNALAAATYTVTFSDITQKITVSTDASITVSMDGVTSPLGFITDFTSATSFEADSILNLEKYDSLFVSINNITEIDYVKGGSTFCLPLSVNSMSVLDYSPSKNGFPQSVQFTSPTSVLSVRVTDSDNSTVDMNDSDWFFVLSSEM
jgi:hypothetical protein